MRFPFTLETNRYYAKATTNEANKFNPSTTPRDDWPTFVREVCKHLEVYRIQGISPDQYKLMLKDHFTTREWKVIFERRVAAITNVKDGIVVCNTVIYWYSVECYQLEARIRDLNKLTRPESLSHYVESIKKYHNLRQKFKIKTPNNEYPDLLDAVRYWTREERRIFFSIRKCLNEIGAPIYEKITPEILAEAITETYLIEDDRKDRKRQLPLALQSGPLEKK